jgi:hypothetical protein
VHEYFTRLWVQRRHGPRAVRVDEGVGELGVSIRKAAMWVRCVLLIFSDPLTLVMRDNVRQMDAAGCTVDLFLGTATKGFDSNS